MTFSRNFPLPTSLAMPSADDVGHSATGEGVRDIPSPASLSREVVQFRFETYRVGDSVNLKSTITAPIAKQLYDVQRAALTAHPGS